MVKKIYIIIFSISLNQSNQSQTKVEPTFKTTHMILTSDIIKAILITGEIVRH